MRSATDRREALKDLLMVARECTRCAELAASRTTVVFGAGNADAELMFVGEAPGANEDLQGLPFVGAAGKLLETLLGEIGLSRAEVFIANVLKCRPPGNRDPRPGEIENCTPYLISQIELVAPRVICTLGNFSTKLLRGDPAGITRVHGRAEVCTIGSHTTRLFPMYHPAAALYTPRTMETLREDFHALPGVLGLPAPDPQAATGTPAVAGDADPPPPAHMPVPAPALAGAEPAGEQLGLF